MIGCTSQLENADLSVSDSQTVEETNQTEKVEENTKTLADFLPTVDGFVKKLEDEGVIDNSMPINDKSNENDYVIRIHSNSANYETVNLHLYYYYRDKEKRIYKVMISALNYSLISKPLQSSFCW